MTADEIEKLRSALRAIHHAEWTWAHEAASKLASALEVAQRERDDYFGAHKLAQERVEALEGALRKVLRHEPWPPSARSQQDFAAAGLLLPEAF